MQNDAVRMFPPEKRIHFQEIDSTNNEARRLLNDRTVAELDGTVITAEYQTAGRGRVEGRQFYSPSGTGLYTSLILRPTDSLITPDLVTPAAGVAVCRTIEKLSGRKALIKWVNDVYLDGKKVCGILTEGTLSPEGRIDALIVGIGVNVREPADGFPPELRDIVTAILPASETAGAENADMENTTWGAALTTDSFLSELLVQLQIVFNADSTDETIGEYQQRSLVVGKRVTVLAGNESYPADVLEVTKKCHLIVRPVDGNGETASSETKELLSGEVSLKLKS